jgi:hypothetical protein
VLEDAEQRQQQELPEAEAELQQQEELEEQPLEE